MVKIVIQAREIKIIDENKIVWLGTKLDSTNSRVADIFSFLSLVYGYRTSHLTLINWGGLSKKKKNSFFLSGSNLEKCRHAYVFFFLFFFPFYFWAWLHVSGFFFFALFLSQQDCKILRFFSFQNINTKYWWNNFSVQSKHHLGNLKWFFLFKLMSQKLTDN